MKLSLILVPILVLGIASGCVSTRVSSLVDPAYRDSSYGRILVIGNFPQIEPTRMSEAKMVKFLQDSGVFAIANSDLLPPLRKYSDSETALIYNKYDLDACIIITRTGDSSEGIYLPGWTNINSGVNYGGYGYGMNGGTAVTTTVSSTPGSYQKTAYKETRADLRDIHTGYLVSRAETSSEETSYPGTFGIGTTREYVMESICQKMVAEFRRNHLLRKK